MSALTPPQGDLFGGGVRQMAFDLPFSGMRRSFRFSVFPAGMRNSTSNVDVEILEVGLGARWAAALDRRYRRRDRAKLVARDFDVEPRTAKGWMAGGAPAARYLVRAARVFGAEILAEVLAPGTEWHKGLRLDAMLGELEGKISEIGDELVVLRSGSGGGNG